MEIEQKSNNPCASRELSGLVHSIRAQEITKNGCRFTNNFREATAFFMF